MKSIFSPFSWLSNKANKPTLPHIAVEVKDWEDDRATVKIIIDAVNKYYNMDWTGGIGPNTYVHFPSFTYRSGGPEYIVTPGLITSWAVQPGYKEVSLEEFMTKYLPNLIK